MLPNRIRTTKDAAEQLKYLKAKTGLTPNILCRIAICKSLGQKRMLAERTQELGGLEFNSVTLFGNYARLYEAMFCQLYGRRDVENIESVIANHIDDGLNSLRGVQSLIDVLS